MFANPTLRNQLKEEDENPTLRNRLKPNEMKTDTHAETTAENADLTKASNEQAALAKKEEASQKKFLWMPRKYGIPVAIIGVTVLAFGVYKFMTRTKA